MAKIKIHSDEYDPMREYDAHIYFTPQTRPKAETLQKALLNSFTPEQMRVSRLVDRPVGPHPLPMFEVNFPKANFQMIRNFLEDNRNGLDVLIHTVTGDDPKDHTEGATWLGQKLELDMDFLT